MKYKVETDLTVKLSVAIGLESGNDFAAAKAGRDIVLQDVAISSSNAAMKIELEEIEIIESSFLVAQMTKEDILAELVEQQKQTIAKLESKLYEAEERINYLES